MRDEVRASRLRRIGILIGAVVVIAVILWLDITSGVWQELVILSGLAAGLVTFLLTVLVLDRVMARSTARRWAPVNRLAFSDFLHALSDEKRSEVSRGRVVPRSLPQLREAPEGRAYLDELHALRAQVVEERALLTKTLSRWAEFLASSGDNDTVLQHLADIALRLDRVRDFALEAEEARDERSRAALVSEIDAGNAHFRALIEELQARLTEDDDARALRLATRQAPRPGALPAPPPPAGTASRPTS